MLSPRTLTIRTAGMLTAASLIVMTPLSAASALQDTAVPTAKNLETVTVDDTVGVLNEDRLRDALDDISFNEPTKVAVYSREGQYADNINTKTLDYAKASRPEWISNKPEDYGDYWADGYLIITLSVEGDGDGQIGTYFGEDRKVSESQMQSIHEMGYDDFNLSRWTDGVIAVAEKASGLMNRPWYKHPALWWSIGIGGVLSSIIGVSAISIRAGRRKTFASELETGSKHLANVTMDLDETELAARTLPTGSHHAAQLERRFADFMAKYRVSFEAQQDLQVADKKRRSAAAGVAAVQEFKTTAQTLDLTDDAIIAAAALYTRSASWEDAWRAQTKPLSDDLAEIPSLVEAAGKKLRSSAAALESYRQTAQADLADLSTKLKTEQIDVDEALDGLSDLRRELTSRLDDFSEAQIKAYAKTAEEETEMRSAMNTSRNAGLGTSTQGGTILDVTNTGSMYWRVSGYHAGYNSGVAAVTQSREAASSSSGISSGYSGGGGSFSGSGGSSRF